MGKVTSYFAEWVLGLIRIEERRCSKLCFMIDVLWRKLTSVKSCSFNTNMLVESQDWVLVVGAWFSFSKY